MADETSRDAPPRSASPGAVPSDVAGSSPDGRLPTGSRATVLVVDDEAMTRASLARGLALAHFDIATAANGREALRLVADGRVQPAVLVTDIDMPEMNGVELAARLLALRPSLRVVMMTGDVDRAESARRHPSIVDAVLVKPIRVDDLVQVVTAAASQTAGR